MHTTMLQVVLRHKLARISASALLLVGTAYLYTVIPKGFLPSEILDQFNLTTGGRGRSFDTNDKPLEVNSILMAGPPSPPQCEIELVNIHSLQKTFRMTV